jgi:hypothetical protein
MATYTTHTNRTFDALTGYDGNALYEEGFQQRQELKQHHQALIKEENENELLDNKPNGPSPVIMGREPYHLLSDMMGPPRLKESVSCVNSRSCYATSFDRLLEKTGSFRQLTNNYKRGYPDSCSSPSHELVLNYYQTTPF